jgi:hypothetical protein
VETILLLRAGNWLATSKTALMLRVEELKPSVFTLDYGKIIV